LLLTKPIKRIRLSIFVIFKIISEQIKMIIKFKFINQRLSEEEEEEEEEVVIVVVKWERGENRVTKKNVCSKTKLQ